MESLKPAMKSEVGKEEEEEEEDDDDDDEEGVDSTAIAGNRKLLFFLG
jgi:hypothetical protein